MKYFFDTEFIEGFHKPLFGKRRHFIDLISIGIVCEDGRTYYAVSNEFKYKDADKWVQENVIDKIEGELFQSQSTYAKTYFNFGLKSLLKQFGKSNKQIAEDIKEFINMPKHIHFEGEDRKTLEPEFYGYYADYDWVLFCSLFGRMIDLPKGWPMMCFDIQQMITEYKIDKNRLLKDVPQTNEHNALSDAVWNFNAYKWIKSNMNEKR